jgi:hypothetical protein
MALDIAEKPLDRLQRWWDNVVASVDVPLPDEAELADIISQIYSEVDLPGPPVIWSEGPFELVARLQEDPNARDSGPLHTRFSQRGLVAVLHFGSGYADPDGQIRNRLAAIRALQMLVSNVLTRQVVIPGSHAFARGSTAMQSVSWAEWLASFDAFRNVLTEKAGPKFRKESEVWCQLAQYACAGMFTPHCCYLVRKPQQLAFNERLLAHNSAGPAVKFADGFTIYALNGVAVDARVIEEPGYLTVEVIDQERNVEVSRVLIEHYGVERFMVEAGALMVCEDEVGQLFVREIVDDEPIVMVRVKNSTPEIDGTYKHYMLRVPPSVRTPKEAIAWTFDMEESSYAPSIET